MKALDLLTAGGKAHFQFKTIIGGRTRFRPIEGDKGGKLGRQALFHIGRFERRAAHGDAAVFGRNGEPDCRQRTGGAIRSHAGIDADARFASRRRFDLAIERSRLAINIARAGAKQQAQRQLARYSDLLANTAKLPDLLRTP
jgi:hypothetical protein